MKGIASWRPPERNSQTVLSHTFKAKKKEQHSPARFLLGSPRFNAKPAGGAGEAWEAQQKSNIRASIVVSMLGNLVGGNAGGGESKAQRFPGSPMRFVPTVDTLVGVGTGKATDKRTGEHGDAWAPPWRVTVKQYPPKLSLGLVESPSMMSSSKAIPSIANGHATLQLPALGSWLRLITEQAGTPRTPVISPQMSLLSNQTCWVS